MKKIRYIEINHGKIKYGIILIFLIAAFSVSLPAQSVYRLEFPFATSPHSGAAFHILFHHVISDLDNRYVPSNIFCKKDTFSKTGNILYRLLRISTYDFYLAYIPVVNQHEYFGHLAKAKQLKAGFVRYEIYLFPPSGGRAFFGNHKYNPLTSIERMSEFMSGVEANSIMAEKIRINSLLKGSFSFQDAMLYLGARTDFSTYVLFENNGSFDDINQFLFVLNKNAEQEEFIQKKDLVLPAVLSVLLDPYTISSLSLIGQFVINGNLSFNTPFLIRTDKIKILPYYSFELAADGLRHSLNGYISTAKNLYYICLHKSAFSNHKSFGLEMGVFGFPIVCKTLCFDLDLRYWHSDPFTYHNNKGDIQFVKSDGFLFNAKFYQKLFTIGIDNGKHIYMLSGFSMKSSGYTKGYPLNGGLSVNVGLGYS